MAHKGTCMDYCLAWAKDNLGIVQAGIAIVLTLVTGVYVILTWRLVGEAKRQREQAVRPCVIALLKTHEAHINLLYLRFENVGMGAAHSVEIELEGMEDFPGDVSLEKHGLFKKGISVMPPGAKIDIFLLSAIYKWDAVKQLNAAVSVKYKADSGKKFKNSFPLVFSQFEGYEQIGQPPLYEIAKHAEKLTKSIAAFPIRDGRFEVNTHTVEDVDAERSTDSIYMKIRRLSPAARKTVEGEVKRLLSEETGA